MSFCCPIHGYYTPVSGTTTVAICPACAAPPPIERATHPTPCPRCPVRADLEAEVERLRTDLERCRTAHAVKPIMPDSVSPFVLKQHYLADIECDHERRMDKPRCACSLVDLGWHPSVGHAVDALTSSRFT